MNSADPLIARLRAADPSPARAITDEALQARILAGPADPRVRTRPRRWLSLGARQLAFLAVSVAVGATGSAVGVIKLSQLGHASPQRLFAAEPNQMMMGPGGRPPGWRQQVIPGSARHASTVTVPGVGPVQYWVASSRQHGLCTAMRLPDGTWIGFPNRYGVGGPVPGCAPPARVCHPMCVTQLIDGFFYEQTSVQQPGGRQWYIVYGVVAAPGHPTRVRDRITGASAPVYAGRYFAIVIPMGRVPAGHDPHTPYQLEALSARGRVLRVGQLDPGE